MEIKQKHGKHALRKAVTAAVLAGTAFSSLGGFAGAVTTIKAEEYEKVQNYYIYDDEKLRELFAKTLEESGENTEEKEEKILQLLKVFPTEKLKSLIPELAELGLTGGDDSEVALGFLRMVLEEVGRRASENDKVVLELSHKNNELKEKEDKLLELLKEKRHVETELDEKKSEMSKKESELSEVKAELSENNEELTDALKELYNAKEKIDEKNQKLKN